MLVITNRRVLPIVIVMAAMVIGLSGNGTPYTNSLRIIKETTPTNETRILMQMTHVKFLILEP